MGTHLNEHDGDDVAHLPGRLCHPHGCAHSVTWHWQVVGVSVWKSGLVTGKRP